LTESLEEIVTEICGRDLLRQILYCFYRSNKPLRPSHIKREIGDVGQSLYSGMRRLVELGLIVPVLRRKKLSLYRITEKGIEVGRMVFGEVIEGKSECAGFHRSLEADVLSELNDAIYDGKATDEPVLEIAIVMRYKNEVVPIISIGKIGNPSSVQEMVDRISKIMPKIRKISEEATESWRGLKRGV